MSWIDKHSVGCYFCGILFDEREGTNADDHNGNNGGSICPDCLKKINENARKNLNALIDAKE